MPLGSLDLHALSAAYAGGECHPRDVVRALDARIGARGDDGVWISRPSLATMLARAEIVESQRAAGEALPLYGIPFAVKDNIDVAGVPTTAGCPAYAYTPQENAPVVERLLRAGAIYLGKTNLDQFATGLVGTRTPYPVPANAFDARYISGGSSAGSALAVAAGLASFALGTDTAGSGRIPAAFNNIVGLKPTRGLLSSRGVVPACRSLDCVSVFALTCADARQVLEIGAAFDPKDPYSRSLLPARELPLAEPTFRFGVPPADQLEFFGDDQARATYVRALDRLARLGGVRVEIDFEPFHQAALLLYEGPWVAERLANLQDFFAAQADAVHPVVRRILEQAQRYSATDVFLGQQRLEQLRRATEDEWCKMDVMALPSAPTIYTIEQVNADPIRRNSDLGYYTNFVNLLDLCALAIPAGMRADGLPSGITVIAPAFADVHLAALGARFQTDLGGKLGATVYSVPAPPSWRRDRRGTASVRLAVVGAHLTGQPLNHELTERGARLIKSCRTARGYRLYALRGTDPPKPGLVFDPHGTDRGIEIEVWQMPLDRFGDFVAAVPAPLGIGTVVVDDGECVKGFICEPYATADAVDITGSGGWRNYLDDLARRGAAS